MYSPTISLTCCLDLSNENTRITCTPFETECDELIHQELIGYPRTLPKPVEGLVEFDFSTREFITPIRKRQESSTINLILNKLPAQCPSG